MDSSQPSIIFRNLFAAYKKLVDEIGEDAAFEKMILQVQAQQKALVGAFIDNNTLAKGWTDAIPIFRIMGFNMEVVDISQPGIDAMLEIQKVCPVLALAKEYGLETPCRVACEMELEATKRAFPDLKFSILSRQADGDCVCLFKYERPAKQITMQPQNTQSIFARFLDLMRLIPKIFQIGINFLKIRFLKQ